MFTCSQKYEWVLKIIFYFILCNIFLCYPMIYAHCWRCTRSLPIRSESLVQNLVNSFLSGCEDFIQIRFLSRCIILKNIPKYCFVITIFLLTSSSPYFAFFIRILRVIFAFVSAFCLHLFNSVFHSTGVVLLVFSRLNVVRDDDIFLFSILTITLWYDDDVNAIILVIYISCRHYNDVHQLNANKLHCYIVK